MTIVLLLALLTVAVSDSRTVVGRTGESVTLPCTYDVKHHGRLSVCWNRGDLPNSGCNNQIISTDGPSRVSSRYQLLGRVEDGDVSMTIVNLIETDAGRYGCLVEIPGWFNDDKHHFDLSVEPARSVVSDDAEDLNAPQTVTSPTTTEVTQETGSDVSTKAFPLTKSAVQLQQVNSLQMFIGNTVRLSLIIFIPALLLTAAHRVRRSNQRPETDRRLNQSEEEEEDTSV
ncbi:hepatitis A virus cellular receptor 1 homolog [Trachinotus anak]|uniref:hepatitis A virus cellular receptor 1 homolog n=1 Tax=Trachinotus anak TaxID=443729 RepID=UPI0039F1C5B1